MQFGNDATTTPLVREARCAIDRRRAAEQAIPIDDLADAVAELPDVAAAATRLGVAVGVVRDRLAALTDSDADYLLWRLAQPGATGAHSAA